MIGPVQPSTAFSLGSTGLDAASASAGAGRGAAATPDGDSSAAVASGVAMSGADAGLTETAVAVQTQVDAFLSSFGAEIGADRQLRMIIALLILQALLGRNDDDAGHEGTKLAGLLAGLDAFGRPAEFTLLSATNIVQMQHQSTLVYSSQAVQTATETQLGGQGSAGSRLDVTA